MKKLLSAVLCAALIITALPCAYAQSVSSLLTSIQATVPMVKEVKPDADMEVKKSADANFVDGPLTVEEAIVSTTYDFKTTLDMYKVRAAFTNWINIAKGYAVSDADLLARINGLHVKGNFTVEIVYPNALNVPATFTSGTNMYGFNAGASTIFKETGRSVSAVDASTSKLTINITVKDVTDTYDYVVASDMETYLNTYLADIDLTCTGILPAAHGAYTVRGTISGQNTIYDGTDHVGTIDYVAIQTGGGQIEETIIVNTPSTGGTNVSAGTTQTTNKVTLQFVSEGETHYTVTKANKVSVNVEEIEEPTREGYAFVGWFADEGLSIPVSGELEVTEDTTIYAKWVNVTVPGGLNGDDRFAYIIGYPDGDVRPNANITREEIATIYYRLLTKEKRHELYTEENSFTDVDADRWSNEEISTVANGKYIVGDPDGTFRPEDAITRAEFVTIASRFLEDTDKEAYKRFNDIKDHWAEDAILSVANQEWITGYEDGSFRPDEYITRAEAMTIFNRILAHYVNEDSLIDGVKHWPDNKEGAWYYYEVLSATNSRTFTFQADGYSEKWTEIVPNPDWSVIK